MGKALFRRAKRSGYSKNTNFSTPRAYKIKKKVFTDNTLVLLFFFGRLLGYFSLTQKLYGIVF